MAQNELLPDRESKPHILCDNCKSFWRRATCLSFSTTELSEGGDGVPWMPQHIFHSNSRAQIKAAALSGCHFCSILIGNLEGCTGNHEGPEQFPPDTPVYCQISLMNEEHGTFILSLFPCEQSEIRRWDQIINNFPIIIYPIRTQTQNGGKGTIPLASEHIQRIDVDTPGSSRVQTWTYSRATADLIHAWIKDCQANHELCGADHLADLHGPSPSSPRPRRLLDLQAFKDLTKVQLVEAERISLPYCALSYSWGTGRKYLLTSVNLSNFLNEIHLHDLPQTFQDAIKVVRGLGFRYIWIDALCILQDGDTSPFASNDWIDQASKMCDIFGNSVVTIAASEAHHGDQGFITRRNPLSQMVCRLDLESKLPFEVVPPCTPHCVLHPFYNAQYHLDTRAWVLQERLLSARTVHFTRNFVHLECRTAMRCETMSEVGNCHHAGAVVKADYESLFAMILPIGMGKMSGLMDFAKDGFLSYWHKITKKYSATNLSRASDLLIALFGLARPLGTAGQLTWSFGLWREVLLREMLWYVRGGRGVPARNRAPTWAWASLEVTGPQIFYDEFPFTTICAGVTALPDATSFTQKVDLAANEAKFVVKLAGPLKLGVSGSIQHSSQLSSSKSAKDESSTRPHWNCRGLSRKHPECPFHPDYVLPDNIQLYSLLIARSSRSDPTRPPFEGWVSEMGLVLTPIPGHTGRYQRVGYFHHDMLNKDDPQKHKSLPSLFDSTSKTEEIEII